MFRADDPQAGGDVDDPRLVEAAQDALLPKGVAVLPELDLAAAYVVGSDPLRRGGDWFDSIPLGDGRVALVVGDVPGRSLASVATMAQLRGVLAAALLRTGDISESVGELDSFSSRLADSAATSLAVAVLDPAATEVAYCTAGHLAPLLLPADGEPHYLDPTGAGPLGRGVSEFACASHAWSPGDTLLLLSDGVLDRPGRQRSASSVELASTVRTIRDGARGDSLAEHLVRRLPMELTGARGSDDDLMLLAAQLRPTPVAGLSRTLPAVGTSLVEVRRDLDEWLGPLRLSPLDAMSLHHAVGELLANAVQHAYSGRESRGSVSVGVRVTSDAAIEVHVSDEGDWRPEGDTVLAASSGRGLNLARLLTDQLRLETGPGGTSVRLRFSPLSPVSMYTAPPSAPRRRHTPLSAEERAGVLTLSGTADLASADDLRQLLGRATRGSTRDAVVDLAGLDVLDSTAVQVLLDAQQACVSNGRVLDVVTTPASPAQQVLELARLPYRTPVDDLPEEPDA